MNNLSTKDLTTKIEILKAKKAAGILSSEEAALLEKLEAQHTVELIQTLQAKQAAGILTLDELALLEQLISQYPEAIAKKEEKHSGASQKEKDVDEVGVDTGIVDSFSASPALGGLAALGGAGGGSGGGTVASAPLTGNLVNGYTQNAFVYQDKNDNGIFDPSEPYDTTDSFGYFELDGAVGGGGKIYAQPTELTIDTSTGLQVTTQYSANPIGNEVIVSPLSTLVASGVDETKLKSALGIDLTIDLNTLDPVAESLTVGSDQVTALAIKSANVQVANLLKNIEAVDEGLSSDSPVVDAGNSSLSALVKTLNAVLDVDNPTLELDDEDLIANAIKSSAESLGIIVGPGSDIESTISAISSKIASTNNYIATAVSSAGNDAVSALNVIAKAESVAQSTLTNAIKSAVRGDSVDLDNFVLDDDVIANTDIELQLVANSTFDSSLGWSGNAANAVDGVNYANIDTAGNPWDVNLSYGLALSAGETYTLSFRAKGTEGRNLTVGVGLNKAPWTSITEDLTLTEEWKTYTETFTLTTGDPTSRVFFDMGDDLGEVFIDDVSLIGPPPAYELIEPSFSGSLINGYISNARVFQDTNGDGLYAVGEPFAITNSLGEFTLTGNLDDGAALIAESSWTDGAGIAQVATDQTTGATVTTVFTAPAGATVVSPFTTLMTAGMTEAQIKTAFGIADDIPITSFDPIASSMSSTATDAQKQAALQYKAASTAVANILDLATETLTVDGDPTSAASITKIVAKSIADNVAPDGTYDIESSTIVASTMQDAITTSAADVGSVDIVSLSQSLSDKLVAVNTAMLTAAAGADVVAALDSIYKAAKVAQVDLSGSLKDILSPTDGADVNQLVTNLGNIDIAAAIASAVISDATLFGGIDFELDSSEYVLNAFETAFAAIVVDPTDPTNSVLEFTRTEESKSYAGVSLGYLSGGTVDEILVDADAGKTTVLARIWSPIGGIVAGLQIADTEQTNLGNDYFNVLTLEPLEAGWNDVVFDFANPAERWVAATQDNRATGLDANATYDQLSIFIDWNNGKAFDGSQVGTALTEDVTYYVDNVILGFGDPQYYAGGSSDDSGDTGTTATDIVTDGTFALASGDNVTWSGNAYNPVDGVNKSDNQVSANAWDVNLSGAVTLTPGADYTLTFDAKGEAGRTLIAGIGESGGAYRNDTETVTISADWETYTLHLSAVGADSANFEGAMRVLFDMGLDAGAIDLDNVSIVEGAVGTELLDGTATTAYSDSPASPADLTGYQLVFEDTFDTVGAGPDAADWTFDLGDDGWGNNEVQDYQSGLDVASIIDWDTSSQVNGALRITAKK